jgi:hypothetical protein
VTIPQVQAADFFGDGISKINDALAYVLNVAQTLRASDVDSGVGSPVLMEQGSSIRRWVIPDGAVGTLNVLDHGRMLKVTEFSIDTATNEVLLTYDPSSPYNLSAVWSSSRGGLTVPVALTEVGGDPTMWQLPPEAGVNVQVLDHGRLLRRDEFKIVSGVVQLTYTPATTYDISACWGSGGPGMRPIVGITQPDAIGNPRLFNLPVDHGRSVQILDYGFLLSADDYTLDLDAHTVLLHYNPAQPYDVAVSWGYPVVGIYFASEVPTPVPDGVVQTFTLAVTPVTDTIVLRATLSNGSVVFYTQYEDFVVRGRQIQFLGSTKPPSGSTLAASFMSTLLSAGSGTAGPGSNTTVTITHGVDLQQDTLTKVVTTNADGTIAGIQYTDGATVVKTVTFSYNPNGSLASVVEEADGKTFTQNHTYDVNGLWSGVTDSVS